MEIWVCEDDKSLWEFEKEAIKDRFSKASIKFFLNPGCAAQETGNPNFIIIDVGGVMAGYDIISLCRYNVEGLSNMFPGAIFIIYSAIGIYAKDVFDELKSEIQAVTKFVEGFSIEEICNIIEEYL